MQLPPLSPGVRNVLIAMVALYVVELVVSNFVPGGAGLYAFAAWTPTFDLSLLWQPVTHFFVQGPQILGLLMDLLVVYFFAPWLIDRFTQRELSFIGLSVVLGCLVAGVVWTGGVQALGNLGVPVPVSWAVVPAMGWGPMILGAVALFGLAQPNETISLMFVLPMKAGVIVWLSLAFVAVFFLVSPSMATFLPFGGIGGVAAYWFTMGGGGRRRRLRDQGRKIENALKFKVYDGGRQGDQDDWIH